MTRTRMTRISHGLAQAAHWHGPYLSPAPRQRPGFPSQGSERVFRVGPDFRVFRVRCSRENITVAVRVGPIPGPRIPHRRDRPALWLARDPPTHPALKSESVCRSVFEAASDPRRRRWRRTSCRPSLPSESTRTRCPGQGRRRRFRRASGGRCKARLSHRSRYECQKRPCHGSRHIWRPRPRASSRDPIEDPASGTARAPAVPAGVRAGVRRSAGRAAAAKGPVQL